MQNMRRQKTELQILFSSVDNLVDEADKAHEVNDLSFQPEN